MQQATPVQTVLPTTVWHLHCGTVRYFIVGPGATAMHPCSEPVYEGRRPTMTADESRIASAAIALLNQRHSQDYNAGVPEIKRALADAEAGTRAPRLHSKPAQLANTDSAVSGDLCQSIADAVCAQLECSRAALSTFNCRDAVANQAKSLYVAICRLTWPHVPEKTLAASLGLTRSSFSVRLDSHTRSMDLDPTYQNHFRRILENLQSASAA